MIIILGITLELITIILSQKIKLETLADIFTKIGKQGYKIDKEKLAGKSINMPINSTTISSILNFTLSLIPGVNILHAEMGSIILQRKILKAIEEQDALTPLTEEEIVEFNQLENKFNQSIYIITKSNLVEDYPTDFSQKDKNVTPLKHDRLVPLSYSYEEVKKLNAATGKKFITGKVNGISTAIIGIPENETNIQNVTYKRDDFTTISPFIKTTEEEAKQKRYIIYPYSSEVEDDPKLSLCLEEIQNRRLKKDDLSSIDKKTSIELEKLLEKQLLAEETLTKNIKDNKTLVKK